MTNFFDFLLLNPMLTVPVFLCFVVAGWFAQRWFTGVRPPMLSVALMIGSAVPVFLLGCLTSGWMVPHGGEGTSFAEFVLGMFAGMALLVSWPFMSVVGWYAGALAFAVSRAAAKPRPGAPE